jgi:hypothetical protein
MRIPCLCAALVCSLLTACGGNDADQTIDPVELSAAPAQALAGDWPISGYYAFYTVQDQANWEALWSERLSRLDCTQPFNSVACGSLTAPSVDFTRFMLVGLYLDRYGRFNDLSSTLHIHHNDSGLLIEFSGSVQPTPLVPLTAPPVSSFFLIPKPASGYPQITINPNAIGA